MLAYLILTSNCNPFTPKSHFITQNRLQFLRIWQQKFLKSVLHYQIILYIFEEVHTI